MKTVTLVPVADGFSAKIKAYDKAGNEVEVSKLVFEPTFFRSRDSATLAYIRIDDDKANTTALLSVRGSNGRVAIDYPVAKDEPAPAVSTRTMLS